MTTYLPRLSLLDSPKLNGALLHPEAREPDLPTDPTMSEGERGVTLGTLAVKLDRVADEVHHLRTVLSGQDGQSGLVSRLAAIEQKVEHHNELAVGFTDREVRFSQLESRVESLERTSASSRQFWLTLGVALVSVAPWIAQALRALVRAE